MSRLDVANNVITCMVTNGGLTDENFQERSLVTLDLICSAIESDVSIVQIREKGLSVKYLLELSQAVVKAAISRQTKIFVNDRADIAAAVGAAGVHLTEASIPTGVIRSHFPGLLVGVSTHSEGAIKTAARSGADLAFFGPVFETPGKPYLQGIERLRSACRAEPGFPIIAIGGVDGSNLQAVLDAGAAGFAAIRLFEDAAYKQLRAF